MTEKQRQDIAVALVTIEVVATGRDRSTFSDPEVAERSFVRIFACSFACNNTSLVAGVEEAHSLCDNFFQTYYGLLREEGVKDDVLEAINRKIQDRFAEYYKSTNLLGVDSASAIDVSLDHFRGKIPIEAFVSFESAFWSFVGVESQRPELDRREMVIRDPMQSAFGLFLRTWEQAEEQIQEEVRREPESSERSIMDASTEIDGASRQSHVPSAGRATLGQSGPAGQLASAESKSPISCAAIGGFLTLAAIVVGSIFLARSADPYPLLGWTAWTLLLIVTAGWTLGCWMWSRSPTGVTPMTVATTVSWWAVILWSVVFPEFNKLHIVWLAPLGIPAARIAFRLWLPHIAIALQLSPRSVKMIVPLLAGVYIAILWLLS